MSVDASSRVGGVDQARLRRLSDEIAQHDRAAAEIQEDAAKLVGELARQGKTVKNYSQADTARVEAAYAPADELIEKAKALRVEWNELASRVSGTGPGVVGGGLPLGFGTNELRELHSLVMRGTPGSIGGEASRHAIGGTEFPMGVISDYRLDQVFEWGHELVRVADLFPASPTTARSVTIYRSSAPAAAAAPVAEHALKPVSDPEWEAVELPVRTIAHTALISTQLAADFGRWQDVVAREMINGLVLAESAQIVGGDGTGENLTGILETSGIGYIDRNNTANEPRVEAIHRGLTHVRTLGFVEADTIVIHPNDFERVRFEKTLGAGGGAYLAGSPLEAAPRELWGVKVVPTTGCPEGTVIVGNFADAGKVFVREPVSVVANPWADTGEAGFLHNQIWLRCEERIAFGLTRPAALCEVHLA